MPSKVEHEELEGRPEWSAEGHIQQSRVNAHRLSGVFEQLTMEHAALLSLLLELQTTADPVRRLELLERASAEITAHEQAESAVIGRRMFTNPALTKFAEAHADDAEKVLRVTQQLCTIPPRDEAWNSTLQQLVAILQQHTRLEETRAFPAASAAWGPNTEEIQREYAAARQAALLK